MTPLLPACSLDGECLWHIPGGPSVMQHRDGTVVEYDPQGPLGYRLSCWKYATWSDVVNHYAERYQFVLYPAGSTPSPESAGPLAWDEHKTGFTTTGERESDPFGRTAEDEQ